MILNILFEIISPTLAFALTNGAMQPEFQSFESANSSEMVDLFTGDFKYNIPLMDVEGYPLNLSYKAGVSMESEASWVGLGWSLNPGVLNRMMKGLPDDFNGDEVHSIVKSKPFVYLGSGPTKSNWLGSGYSFGISGIPIYGVSDQSGESSSNVLVYNNHKGYGYERGYDSHYSLNVGVGGWSLNFSTGYNTTYNSQEGGSFGDTYSSGYGFFGGFSNASWGKGTNYNTRNGATTNSRYGSIGKPDIRSVVGAMVSSTSGGYCSIPVGAVSYAPTIPFNMLGGGASHSERYGTWGKVNALGISINGGDFEGVQGFYRSMSASSNNVIRSYGYLYSQNADNNSLMDFNRFREGAIMDETPNGSSASSTYDLFFASAQGMSSAFRPFRSDISAVHDPDHKLVSNSIHSGYEFGGDFIAHELSELSTIAARGLSNQWPSPFLAKLSHASHQDIVTPSASFSIDAQKALIENTYFKELGDLCERDDDYETDLHFDYTIYPELVNVGPGYSVLSPIENVGRKKRDVRSKHIKSLTADQASQFGVERKINLYDKNTFSINSSNKLVSVSSNSTLINIDRRFKNSFLGGVTGTIAPVNHHISEVSLTNKHGDHYVYGIPSYNLYKKITAFNASDREEDQYVFNSTLFNFPSITYSHSPLNISEPCQFVEYTAKDINDNKRGNDNFLKIDETPAYSSSFLLTSVLSSDYVDVTGNGPSYDDLGSFTKFNYSKENNYRWREPYCLDSTISGSTLAGGISTATNHANFDKGLISDDLDDNAQYEYGIRESYYVHSIETKNYVAVFRTSARSDGMGVQNESGAKGTIGEMLKLDRLDLYSKNEILEKGITNAIPLKSVHFEYNYSLCHNTFNTISSNNIDHGKLTLTKVYFTYGTSNKSALSPYEFFYADNSHTSAILGAGSGGQNFNYDPRSIDRWGSYLPNNGSVVGSTVGLNNIEFPYSEQNKELADSYAAAWNLTQIKTPSGASIKITYEADDYGYVQDRPVSQMCQIYNCVPGVSNFSIDVTATYGNPSTCNIKDNPSVIVDLSSMSNGISTLLSQNDANDYAAKVLCFNENLNKPFDLYFKTFLKVADPSCGAGLAKEYYEFINGYTNITNVKLFDGGIANNTYTVMNSAGTGTTSCYRFACVQLQPTKVVTKDWKSKRSRTYSPINFVTSPICMAGWDFLRNYAPRIAYPGSEPANMGGSLEDPVVQKLNSEAGLGVAKIDLEDAKLGNANKRFYDQNFCVTLFPNKSFVRLYSAHNTKLGGGHRVKKIITEDDWAGMTNGINSTPYSENSTSYGQTFEYTFQDPISGVILTSGVASYEPLVGGDENSMRQPIGFEVEKKYAPNDHFFQEEPLGEMLYPMPVVGYSKVTLRTISDPSVLNVAASGKTEFEFFTAKDFPIVDKEKGRQRKIQESIPPDATLSSFINRLDNPAYVARKIFHLTQGFLLKFNDMHGKLKSIAVFGEDNSLQPIEKTKYSYKTKTDEPESLANSVPTINEQNIISDKVINRDIDVTADTRQNVTETTTLGNSTVHEIGVGFIPPFWIGPDVPTYNESLLHGLTIFGFNGASLTKVVQEYGILEKIEQTYNGSKTTTENLLWDANTGDVLLTKVLNEFDEPVYNFNYPAYWAYKEMSPEFKRDGIGLFCAHLTSSLSVIKPLDVSTGSFSYTSVNDPVIFEPGDEVLLTDVTNPSSPLVIGDRFWLVRDPSTSTYNLVDRVGKLMTTTNYTALNVASDYVIRLIKPINKNNLVASIGYVTSLTDPQFTNSVSVNEINFSQSNQKILDAAAIEYCSGGGLYKDPLLTQQQGANVPMGSYSMTSINPVISEGYGNMKPITFYKFKTIRTYSAQPNIKSDGLYPSSGTGSFTPFWFQESGNPYLVSIRSDFCSIGISGKDRGNWIAFEKEAYYSPYGDQLQVKNAIDVNSATRTGFNHTLPILEATNARVTDVGFESFEEYRWVYPFLTAGTSTGTSRVFNNDHLGFYNQISPTGSLQPNYTSNAAHTGKYSLFYQTNQSVDLKYNVNQFYSRQKVTYGVDDVDCGCRLDGEGVNAVKLDLDQNKTYIASMWVKGTTQSTDYASLVNFSVTQTYGVSSVANGTTTLVKSNIINGWQKLDYEIKLSSLPGTSPYVIDIFINSGSTGSFYLDDFRIQPFNSTMTCRVYDPFQLKLCAELDDRNFATIYEYDQEGMLVRKKKETLNALQTVQEIRTGKNKR